MQTRESGTKCSPIQHDRLQWPAIIFDSSSKESGIIQGMLSLGTNLGLPSSEAIRPLIIISVFIIFNNKMLGPRSRESKRSPQEPSQQYEAIICRHEFTSLTDNTQTK